MDSIALLSLLKMRDLQGFKIQVTLSLAQTGFDTDNSQRYSHAT
ncbi:hypothetical protein GMES_0592 [Paraglaciecola mesophila KMM 241]|uniref:Uncharacterized protein n=1 Tax=Paraglaciecola mesophila KMM 241 TaxID=1128912 RepID=K6Z1P1_9ALTE|nr:hypothetical protein GMES_0592 [Paraglaciecola mesophila KMM 241]